MPHQVGALELMGFPVGKKMEPKVNIQHPSIGRLTLQTLLRKSTGLSPWRPDTNMDGRQGLQQPVHKSWHTAFSLELHVSRDHSQPLCHLQSQAGDIIWRRSSMGSSAWYRGLASERCSGWILFHGLPGQGNTSETPPTVNYDPQPHQTQKPNQGVGQLCSSSGSHACNSTSEQKSLPVAPCAHPEHLLGSSAWFGSPADRPYRLQGLLCVSTQTGKHIRGPTQPLSIATGPIPHLAGNQASSAVQLWGLGCGPTEPGSLTNDSEQPQNTS